MMFFVVFIVPIELVGRPLSGIAKQPYGLSLTTVVPTSYQPLTLMNTTKDIIGATHSAGLSLALQAVGTGENPNPGPWTVSGAATVTSVGVRGAVCIPKGTVRASFALQYPQNTAHFRLSSVILNLQGAHPVNGQLSRPRSTVNRSGQPPPTRESHK